MLDLSPRERDQVLAILGRRLPGREVWVFGSRARGAAKPHSDLDLAIVGDAPVPDVTLAYLQDDLAESDLPFRVDVLDLCGADPAFRERVERDHVVLARRG